MGVNDDIADRLITNAVALSRFDAELRAKVLGYLAELEAELLRLTTNSSVADGARVTTRQRRAEALFKETQALIVSDYRAIKNMVSGDLAALAGLQGEAIMSAVNGAVKADIFTVSMTPGELKTLAKDTLIQGSPAEEWWGQQAGNTKARFQREVRMGLMSGETNDQIVRRVRGTATGERKRIRMPNGKSRLVRVFRSGVMPTSTREAESLVRTAVQTVGNRVDEAMFRANQDVLRGIQALVTLDGKTTLTCISRSGAGWYFDGRPFEESPRQEQYPGPAPWHFGCRTKMSPVTKSWDDMIQEAGGKVKTNIKKVGPKKRASMDGLVAGDVSFDGWLKTKSKGFQIDKLGKERWELWNEGKLPLSKLTDFTGRPLTVDQLKKNL
tara:strand:- start:2739 stop:3890 length:1152 start_codon:yes stop_codon:yes gene_type:complete